MKAVDSTKYFLILMGASLLAWPPAFATAPPGQQPAPKGQPPRPDCPQPYARLESSEWSGRVMHHALSAGLNGGSAKQGLTYKWEVSPGAITSGQGGPSLTVGMPECECDFNVRLEVGGLEPGCPKTVEWGIRDLCFYPVGAESYGGISRDEERALLSKYAPLLKRQCWQMRITSHGDKAGRAGGMLARAERAKRYIVEEHGVEAERVTVTGGGPQDGRRISLLVFHGRLGRKGGGRR